MGIFKLKSSEPPKPEAPTNSKLAKLSGHQLHAMAESELMFAQAKLADYHSRVGDPVVHLLASMEHAEFARLAMDELRRRVDEP